jgi:ELWxxDGT repeat protein
MNYIFNGKLFSIVLIGLLWPTLQSAQSLVNDIHPGKKGYNPRNIILSKDAFLFITSDPSDGYGKLGKGETLYKSNGQDGGTKALFGNALETQGGKIWSCTVFGDEAYFGFYLKKNISIIKVNLLNDSVEIVKKFETRLLEHELFYLNFTEYEGQIYFFFKNELSAFELWKTRGDENSTELVYTFSFGQSVRNIFRTSKCIFFETVTQQKVNQIWRFNLDLEKAEKFYSFRNGELYGTIRRVEVVNDHLIFQDHDINSPMELWAADELSALPVKIKGKTSEILHSSLDIFGTNNGRLFFQTKETKIDSKQKNNIGEPLKYTEYSIWSTDGSIKGTEKIFKLPEGTGYLPFSSIIVENYIYFILDAEGFFKGLCRLNLLKPRQLEKIIAATPYYDYQSLGLHGNFFYFYSKHLKSLLKTDGTPEGSKLISIESDLAELSGSYDTRETILNDDFFFFSRKDNYFSLWKMAIPTGKISNVANELSEDSPNYSVRSLIAGWKQKLIINANDPMYGTSLWIHEPESPSNHLVDVSQTPKGSDPSNFHYFDDQLYFTAQDPKFGFELRNTLPGTNQVNLTSDICDNCGWAYQPSIVAVIDSTLYFSEAIKPNVRSAYWKIEKGSQNQIKKAHNPDSLHHYFVGKRGLIPIDRFTAIYRLNKRLTITSEKSLRVDTLIHKPYNELVQICILDDGYALFLAGNKNSNSKGLFLTDGSSKGTFLIKEGIFNKWRAASIASGEMIPKLKNKYFIYFSDDQHGTELWTFDLVTRTLTFLKDLTPGQDGSIFTGSACLGNKCFFLSKDAKGPKFWSSDGTSQGTLRLDSLFAKHPKYKDYEKTRFELFDPFTLGKYIFFNLRVGNKFGQLWRTDGTPEGTIPLSDNIEITHPQKFIYLGPHIYYFQKSPTYGEELWRTDGTPAGTKIVFDLNPGPASSSPRNLTQVNDEVYFSADDGIHGTELFKFKPAEVAIKIPKPFQSKWVKSEQKYFIEFNTPDDSKACKYALYSSSGEIISAVPIYERSKVAFLLKNLAAGTYWLTIAKGKDQWMEAIVKD